MKLDYEQYKVFQILAAIDELKIHFKYYFKNYCGKDTMDFTEYDYNNLLDELCFVKKVILEKGCKK